jgi:hypothetical protein
MYYLFHDHAIYKYEVKNTLRFNNDMLGINRLLTLDINCNKILICTD